MSTKIYFVSLILCISAFLIGNATAVLSFDGPLKVSKDNPRFFTDNSGKIIYLAGIHTWRNFQAIGSDNFDFNSYIQYLALHNMNFVRLWNWENDNYASGFGNNPVSPMPFQKSGTKYDVTRFNQEYFDRLKQYVSALSDKNIYVSVQLFNGWSVGTKLDSDGNPFPYHPFKLSNNINGINGDYLLANGNSGSDSQGYEIHSLRNSEITSVQKAYITKVIDTVNEFDNVLYEICNESEGGQMYVDWQNAMITFIHEYESTKPKKHPVGFTHPYSNITNTELFNSNADWIAPGDGGSYMDNPPINTGAKVIIADTDHLWGLGGDRYWAWKSAMRGINVSYMDCYAKGGSLEAQLGCPISFNDGTRTNLITNMEYIRTYLSKINSITTIPSTTVSSTGYALINGESQILVYQPNTGSFTINLSTSKQAYSVEWYNPALGTIIQADSVIGGTIRTFVPPFNNDAVVFLQTQNTTSPTQSLTQMPLTNTPVPTRPCPLTGDTNTCDGKVDVLDYSYLSSKFNSTDTKADLDGNSKVNILDYTILSNNFGKKL